MFMFLFLFFSMLLLCSFFRLKELSQVKNGVTTSLLFFFLKMPKIWVGRTTVNGEKKEDGLMYDKVTSDNSSLSLSHNKHCTKNKLETVLWKNPRKLNVVEDQYINNLSKSQVFVVYSFWVICLNIRFHAHSLEVCMETPYWWTETVHQYARRK